MSIIVIEWKPTEGDVRHKSKGWANKRRRSKCRSKINVHKNKWKKATTKLNPRNVRQQRAYMMCTDLLHSPITSMKRSLSFWWSNSPQIENFCFSFDQQYHISLSETFWIKKWIDKYKYIDDSLPIFNISAQSKSNIRNSVWVSYVRNSCSFFTFQEHARYIFH